MPKGPKPNSGKARGRSGAPKALPPLSSKPDPLSARHLSSARARIDELDKKLVKLLNERAALVVDVGKFKRKAGLPIYAPHREAEVLDKVIHANSGPLPNRTLEGVYRELMSGSFQLQQPLRIGYLGPQGSYSHAAAVRHFGSSVAFEDLHEIAGVFTEVARGHVNYGLVPIENSTGGGVVETLDALKQFHATTHVYAEVQLEVHHALLANCEPKDVRRIHSKPEVFSQCRQWLATQYPRADLIPAASSSRAAQIAAEECRKALEIGAVPGTAAIGSDLAGQIYGLKTLFARIEDNPNNITRFFVIARSKAVRSGDDKTSIMFTTEDKPGTLVDVLGVFRDRGVNLSHIDKRPSGRVNWSYTFFIDALGHRDDPQVAGAIEEASEHCQELIVLGSYPRARRIL
jgi:chorismate mutase/prephenate dehydratase